MDGNGEVADHLETNDCGSSPTGNDSCASDCDDVSKCIAYTYFAAAPEDPCNAKCYLFGPAIETSTVTPGVALTIGNTGEDNYLHQSDPDTGARQYPGDMSDPANKVIIE